MDGQRKLSSLMQRPPPQVHPTTEQKQVASVAIGHGIASVPVVDAEGVLLGAVPTRAIFEVLRREHVEDLHRLAGIRRESRRARAALEEPPVRHLRDRLPWLQAICRTVPRSLEQWAVILLVGTTVILRGELDEWRNRRREAPLG